MKKLLALVIGLALLWGAGSLLWPAESPEEILQNRIWISHAPRSLQDKASLLVFIDDEEAGPLDHSGAFVHSSAYQGDFDAFIYSVDGEKISLTMLQEGKPAKMRYHARRCSEGKFEFCLELKGAPRGPVRYYSNRDLELNSEAAKLLLGGATEASLLPAPR